MLEKIKNFVDNKFVPATQKISTNNYVSGIQKAVLKCVPMILVSSVITIYNIIRGYVPSLPALDSISNYSFGLMGLFTAFLIPYYILEDKHDSRKVVGGMTGLALFMMAMKPEATDAGFVYNFYNFAAQGMFVSIVIGILIVWVFMFTSKLKLISEESVLPDFCKEWFNSIIPICVLLFIGTIVIDTLNINVFDAIISLFSPLMKLNSTYWGGFIMALIVCIIYTLGLSPWVLDGMILPITNAALAANIAAHAAGEALPYIYTYGFEFAYVLIGGCGATLPLVIYFLRSRSKRLKLLGKVYLVPSIMNINEPIMYGNIAWNPVLMIPSWLCTIANYTVAYFIIKIGLVTAPFTSVGLWFAPYPIPSFLLGGIPGVLLCLVIVAMDFVIWYPFFKAYEASAIKEESVSED